ncbi:MAG TPA: hypothetical protein VL026_00130 [Rhizomicrobium sp.]|nr:hypothetical protein [Rhizomicrobium sp.]
MSELITIREHRAFTTKHLLATVSALALTGYIASSTAAKADDATRPTVWVELGGQMEFLQGASSTFTAPFMSVEPKGAPEGADYILPAGAYNPDLFGPSQRPVRRAFGLEGKVLFQPEASDWTFSAAVRYGRSHTHGHAHEQGAGITIVLGNILKLPANVAEFADEEAAAEESHMFLDFQAGKDVGLGAIGRNGQSNISAGIRFAQLSLKSDAVASARPMVGHVFTYQTYFQYKLTGEQQRNFRAIGPSLSWNASTALLGDKDDAELSLDWGINGAVLFGRQKAHVAHTTAGYHVTHPAVQKFAHNQLYANNGDTTRSRSIVVPNLGAFAGLSVRYPYARVSFGYRADFLFGAMDIGIDARKTTTTGFHGPFAKLSIGL